MNCLCNLFDDNVIWIVVIALLILYVSCNQTNGCGCGR